MFKLIYSYYGNKYIKIINILSEMYSIPNTIEILKIEIDSSFDLNNFQ